MYTNLRFRTFDQLIAAVADDLFGFDTENSIDYSNLIKDVLNVNKQIGLKIHSEYETILEVKNHKASLPDNFYKINHASICSKYTYRGIAHSLTTENVEICDTEWQKAMEQFPEEFAISYTCTKPYHVTKGSELYEYNVNSIIPLKINTVKNKHICNKYDITIGDGYITTSIKEGKVLINYFGALEDEEGNLLVLDHPIINEFYEYTLKKKVLENLWLNGEEEVYNKLIYIKNELREAKIKAYGIINTPEISDIVQSYNIQREKIINKYFNIIQGAGSLNVPLNVFIQ